jgi:anhydro-N-acetylmuramic acid kinase
VPSNFSSTSALHAPLNSPLNSQLYIGLMSGTSMDGVDAALVDFSQEKPQVVATESIKFATELRADLMALNHPGPNELHRAALAANALMRQYAQVVHVLLGKSGLGPLDIRAVGAHGQTVRHRPQQFDGTGYTWQLCNPSLLAELTGIDVAADFRSRDVVCGGQGAPLAPFFHQAWFAQSGKSIGVLNIGGISNLTVLQPGGGIIGFDCGPGNALVDYWCERHTGEPFDAAGAWAAQGQVNEAFLSNLLSEPYFQQSPPKSTGRDLFNAEWLLMQWMPYASEAPQNIQRTLLELTARSIAHDVLRQSTLLSELIVCGGGAYNLCLMQRLQALLPDVPVISSQGRGLPPQDVEAVAFAWLARQCVERQPLPLASVTGARGARVLGGIYPA